MRPGRCNECGNDTLNPYYEVCLDCFKHEPGTIYLLHFDPPYYTFRRKRRGHPTVSSTVRHYMGWTSRAVETRLDEHRRGRGSMLVYSAYEKGCKVTVVRTWENKTRKDERRLKDRKENPFFCPVCRAVATSKK